MTNHLWFFEIFVGILALVGIGFLFSQILKYLRRRSMLIGEEWKDKIASIFSLPFKILLCILGISLIIDISARHFQFSLFDNYISAFRSAGLIVCIAWMVLRWKKQAQRLFLQKDKHFRNVDPSFVHIIGRLVSLMVIFIASMLVLQVFGLNVAPLIAFGGIGAAALGFAAKDVISNFFGGLMLHLNRPFTPGDYIQLPGRSLEGTVEEIGWNLTTIRDRLKRPVYLPNALFSAELVSNFSRMTHRRLEEKVQIEGKDGAKLSLLSESLKSLLSQHPKVDTHLPLSVVFDSFFERTLTLYLSAFILETRLEKYLEVRHEILLDIYKEMQKLEVDVSIPSMTIYTEMASKN